MWIIFTEYLIYHLLYFSSHILRNSKLHGDHTKLTTSTRQFKQTVLKSNINAYSRISEIQLVLIMIKYIFIYIYMKYKISSWDDALWQQGKVWTKRCNHPVFYVQASTLFRPWIHLGYIACNFVEMFLERTWNAGRTDGHRETNIQLRCAWGIINNRNLPMISDKFQCLD